MTFKSFVWPNDPSNLNITLLKKNKTDVDNLKILKIIEGSGNFFGPDCHKYFSKLSEIFNDPSPGKLLIPGFNPINAFFSELSITSAPSPEQISYRFKFSENILKSNKTQKTNNIAYYYIKQNESLWEVSEKFDIPIETLLKKNPSISNPYDIKPEQKILIF
ncbi:MAG: LysM peptidoglycan-binding domain-containing protein [Oscillospiraceae bacterium]|nr:LysM peptidoglycan-binding domain-containing protein [Oscillospiraceae bacterium]